MSTRDRLHELVDQLDEPAAQRLLDGGRFQIARLDPAIDLPRIAALVRAYADLPTCPWAPWTLASLPWPNGWNATPP